MYMGLCKELCKNVFSVKQFQVYTEWFSDICIVLLYEEIALYV